MNDNPFMSLPDKKSIDLTPAIRTIKDLGLVYPVLEAGAQLATSQVGMIAGGLAGLGAEATNALGITDTNPVDIIHKTANALTYHPQTVEGENLSNVVAYPFSKLSETANKAGEYVTDKTGSPALGAAANVLVNLGPFAALPIAKGIKGKFAELTKEEIAHPPTTAEDIVTVKPDITKTAPQFSDLPNAKEYLDPGVRM